MLALNKTTIDLPYRDRDSSHMRGGHYYLAMRPDVLKDWASDMAKLLKEQLGDIEPIFCYSGMSGVAYATALALIYPTPLHMCYVRKEHEEAHSGIVNVTGNQYSKQDKMFVFVDDAIDTGSTINYTMRKVFTADVFTKNYKLVNRDSLLTVLTNSLGHYPLNEGEPWQ